MDFLRQTVSFAPASQAAFGSSHQMSVHPELKSRKAVSFSSPPRLAAEERRSKSQKRENGKVEVLLERQCTQKCHSCERTTEHASANEHARTSLGRGRAGCCGKKERAARNQGSATPGAALSLSISMLVALLIQQSAICLSWRPIRRLRRQLLD